MLSQDNLVDRLVGELVNDKDNDGKALADLVSYLFCSREVYLWCGDKAALNRALFKALHCKDDHLFQLAAEDLVRACYFQAEHLKNIPGISAELEDFLVDM